jgi:hypothetical protein
MMSVTELLPTLRSLGRADKLRVMQFLVSELAKEEGLLLAGAEYPVWSPYNAFDGATTLLNVLAEDKKTHATTHYAER